ncbi:Cysteine-rich CWC [Polaromonas sp. OV174]|uniref:cysteine-rich CWC family protein n=1 Tax=Polaromonas sp. OV174 TaxID=1855300 RepID=UPI0008F10E7E|nr:cysteine-rich CWC family protein [Polaromonas sp. OV174]SFC00509.1 Cysteine-rich CWC [Polaromonas sp. OV174]
MTSPAPTLPNTSVCPRCGAGLRCGMVAGDAECWCMQLPHVMPVPEARKPPAPSQDGAAAASCYCPACLKQITDERKNALSPAPD